MLLFNDFFEKQYLQFFVPKAPFYALLRVRFNRVYCTTCNATKSC